MPVLAYKEEKQPIPHSVYESIICNEFLEVGFEIGLLLPICATADGHAHTHIPTQPAKRIDRGLGLCHCVP